MASNLYKKVEKYVQDSFTKAGKAHQIKHFIRTAHWIKELKPDVDEALLIAAVAHDIERAFRQEDLLEKKHTIGFTHKEFYGPHQERGAEIIGAFLKKQGASQELIARVKMLVLKHEEGGNEDQDLVKDADSVSFFENNVEHFLTNKVKEIGKEKVKMKLDWMFNRITSEKAEEIARSWYEEAIKKLGYAR